MQGSREFAPLHCMQPYKDNSQVKVTRVAWDDGGGGLRNTGAQ